MLTTNACSFILDLKWMRTITKLWYLLFLHITTVIYSIFLHTDMASTQKKPTNFRKDSTFAHKNHYFSFIKTLAAMRAIHRTSCNVQLLQSNRTGMNLAPPVFTFDLEPWEQLYFVLVFWDVPYKTSSS